MSREQQLRDAETRERRSAQIRSRFGLGTTSDADGVRDWLLTSGAIPATLAVLALAIYLIVEAIVALAGS